MAHVRLTHAPSLTGVRAVAVLVVMVYHAGIPIYGGHIGVNIFFVLSGFLITHLLLDETELRGRIAFRNFYARRALRLYPALVILVIIVAIYSVVIPDATRADESISAIPAVLFYLANWVRALRPESAGETLGLFEHTWSLAIEEQFYFIWPFVIFSIMYFTRRLLHLAVVIIAGILGAVSIRFLIAPEGEGLMRISNGLDTQADQLLVGAGLAVLVILGHRRGRIHTLERAFRLCFWPAVAVLGGSVAFWPHHGQQWWLRILMLIVALAAATVIGALYLNKYSFAARALATDIARWVGDRSYALYLWHYPIFTVLIDADAPIATRGLMAALAVILSFTAAHASYELIEKPFLRVKDRLARKERAA